MSCGRRWIGRGRVRALPFSHGRSTGPGLLRHIRIRPQSALTLQAAPIAVISVADTEAVVLQDEIASAHRELLTNGNSPVSPETGGTMGTIFFGQARSQFIHSQHDSCAGVWEEGAVELLSL